MRRTVENIKDPLFRFFEREVNAGVKLLADVRRDMEEVMAICQGEKKPTNHHRTLMSELAKGEISILMHAKCQNIAGTDDVIYKMDTFLKLEKY